MNRADLVRVIGIEAALKLTHAAGGKRLFVAAARDGDPVIKLIGADAYNALAAEFGGESVDLPSYQTILSLVRKRAAQEMLRAGRSIRATAAETRLSRRAVARLRDELSAEAFNAMCKS